MSSDHIPSMIFITTIHGLIRCCSTKTKQSPEEDIRYHSVKSITRAARYCEQFYNNRTSNREGKDITIEYPKTNYEIFERILKDIYEYVLVYHRNVRYFQYLCKGYLKPPKFRLWCRTGKSYVPRMTQYVGGIIF